MLKIARERAEVTKHRCVRWVSNACVLISTVALTLIFGTQSSAAPPLITDVDLPKGQVGSSYSGRITASGTPPFTWSVAGLPPGLAYTSATNSLYISGVPTQSGIFSVIVTVTDNSTPPNSTQQNFVITIEKGSYEATITIGTGLKAGETRVFIGATPLTTLRGGESVKVNLDLGVMRTVSVDSIVEHPTEPGIRFKAEIDKRTVSESSPDAVFPYYAEYYIDFKTDPSKVGQLSGSGWFREGYVLGNVAPEEVTDSERPDIKYRFAYWVLPSGETTSSRQLSFRVSLPGTCTAKYDTYYKLTLASEYGGTEGSSWYKSGTLAEWKIGTTEVRMPGILGIFGGKLRAATPQGTVSMDEPKTIEVRWEPDYNLPIILIPLTLVLLTGIGYGFYLLARSTQPKPVFFPPPYPPAPPQPPPQMPPPQTTVVMIGGEKPKLGPAATREQLMEKFGELLQKYEEEIRATILGKELPETKTVERGLPTPSMSSATIEAEVVATQEPVTCDFSTKRALRLVVTEWRRSEPKTITPSVGDEKPEGKVAVVWSRDIYQEWEIMRCLLRRGHAGQHEGALETVYSFLNSLREERTYSTGEELLPPKPHYTDGMPVVDLNQVEILPPEKLPPMTA